MGIQSPPARIHLNEIMEFKLDTESFERRQALFIGEIVEKIMIKLREGGLEGRQLEELTANIAFSVASALDDTSMIEAEGIEIHPYLAFRIDDDEVVHCGENAYSYEFVIPALKRLFEA